MKIATVMASLLLLLAVGCIDNRQVDFGSGCFVPQGGLLSDFSEARVRSCPTGYCATELVGSDSVSLGEGTDAVKTTGLVFPYASSGSFPVLLGLASTVSAADAGTGQALRVATPAYPAGGASTPYGFALRFASCVETKGYKGVSFTAGPTAEDIGTCPLRFAVEFLPADAGSVAVQPLDESAAASIVPVTAGATTLLFGESAGVSQPSVLAGMQWEFTLPGGTMGCNADFTIDDIRLIPLP